MIVNPHMTAVGLSGTLQNTPNPLEYLDQIVQAENKAVLRSIGDDIASAIIRILSPAVDALKAYSTSGEPVNPQVSSNIIRVIRLLKRIRDVGVGTSSSVKAQAIRTLTTEILFYSQNFEIASCLLQFIAEGSPSLGCSVRNYSQALVKHFIDAEEPVTNSTRRTLKTSLTEFNEIRFSTLTAASQEVSVYKTKADIQRYPASISSIKIVKELLGVFSSDVSEQDSAFLELLCAVRLLRYQPTEARHVIDTFMGAVENLIRDEQNGGQTQTRRARRGRDNTPRLNQLFASLAELFFDSSLPLAVKLKVLQVVKSKPFLLIQTMESSNIFHEKISSDLVLYFLDKQPPVYLTKESLESLQTLQGLLYALLQRPIHTRLAKTCQTFLFSSDMPNFSTPQILEAAAKILFKHCTQPLQLIRRLLFYVTGTTITEPQLRANLYVLSRLLQKQNADALRAHANLQLPRQIVDCGLLGPDSFLIKRLIAQKDTPISQDSLAYSAISLVTAVCQDFSLSDRLYDIGQVLIELAVAASQKVTQPGVLQTLSNFYKTLGLKNGPLRSLVVSSRAIQNLIRQFFNQICNTKEKLRTNQKILDLYKVSKSFADAVLEGIEELNQEILKTTKNFQLELSDYLQGKTSITPDYQTANRAVLFSVGLFRTLTSTPSFTASNALSGQMTEFFCFPCFVNNPTLIAAVTAAKSHSNLKVAYLSQNFRKALEHISQEPGLLGTDFNVDAMKIYSSARTDIQARKTLRLIININLAYRMLSLCRKTCPEVLYTEGVLRVLLRLTRDIDSGRIPNLQHWLEPSIGENESLAQFLVDRSIGASTTTRFRDQINSALQGVFQRYDPSLFHCFAEVAAEQLAELQKVQSHEDEATAKERLYLTFMSIWRIRRLLALSPDRVFKSENMECMQQSLSLSRLIFMQQPKQTLRLLNCLSKVLAIPKPKPQKLEALWNQTNVFACLLVESLCWLPQESLPGDMLNYCLLGLYEGFAEFILNMPSQDNNYSDHCLANAYKFIGRIIKLCRSKAPVAPAISLVQIHPQLKLLSCNQYNVTSNADMSIRAQRIASQLAQALQKTHTTVCHEFAADFLVEQAFSTRSSRVSIYLGKLRQARELVARILQDPQNQTEVLSLNQGISQYTNTLGFIKCVVNKFSEAMGSHAQQHFDSTESLGDVRRTAAQVVLSSTKLFIETQQRAQQVCREKLNVLTHETLQLLKTFRTYESKQAAHKASINPPFTLLEKRQQKSLTKTQQPEGDALDRKLDRQSNKDLSRNVQDFLVLILSSPVAFLNSSNYNSIFLLLKGQTNKNHPFFKVDMPSLAQHLLTARLLERNDTVETLIITLIEQTTNAERLRAATLETALKRIFYEQDNKLTLSQLRDWTFRLKKQLFTDQEICQIIEQMCEYQADRSQAVQVSQHASRGSHTVQLKSNLRLGYIEFQREHPTRIEQFTPEPQMQKWLFGLINCLVQDFLQKVQTKRLQPATESSAVGYRKALGLLDTLLSSFPVLIPYVLRHPCYQLVHRTLSSTVNQTCSQAQSQSGGLIDKLKGALQNQRMSFLDFLLEVCLPLIPLQMRAFLLRISVDNCLLAAVPRDETALWGISSLVRTRILHSLKAGLFYIPSKFVLLGTLSTLLNLTSISEFARLCVADPSLTARLKSLFIQLSPKSTTQASRRILMTLARTITILGKASASLKLGKFTKACVPIGTQGRQYFLNTRSMGRDFLKRCAVNQLVAFLDAEQSDGSEDDDSQTQSTSQEYSQLPAFEIALLVLSASSPNPQRLIEKQGQQQEAIQPVKIVKKVELIGLIGNWGAAVCARQRTFLNTLLGSQYQLLRLVQLKILEPQVLSVGRLLTAQHGEPVQHLTYNVRANTRRSPTEGLESRLEAFYRRERDDSDHDEHEIGLLFTQFEGLNGGDRALPLAPPAIEPIVPPVAPAIECQLEPVPKPPVNLETQVCDFSNFILDTEREAGELETSARTGKSSEILSTFQKHLIQSFQTPQASLQLQKRLSKKENQTSFIFQDKDLVVAILIQLLNIRMEQEPDQFIFKANLDLLNLVCCSSASARQLTFQVLLDLLLKPTLTEGSSIAQTVLKSVTAGNIPERLRSVIRILEHLVQMCPDFLRGSVQDQASGYLQVLRLASHPNAKGQAAQGLSTLLQKALRHLVAEYFCARVDPDPSRQRIDFPIFLDEAQSSQFLQIMLKLCDRPQALTCLTDVLAFLSVHHANFLSSTKSIMNQLQSLVPRVDLQLSEYATENHRNVLPVFQALFQALYKSQQILLLAHEVNKTSSETDMRLLHQILENSKLVLKLFQDWIPKLFEPAVPLFLHKRLLELLGSCLTASLIQQVCRQGPKQEQRQTPTCRYLSFTFNRTASQIKSALPAQSLIDKAMDWNLETMSLEQQNKRQQVLRSLVQLKLTLKPTDRPIPFGEPAPEKSLFADPLILILMSKKHLLDFETKKLILKAQLAGLRGSKTISHTTSRKTILDDSMHFILSKQPSDLRCRLRIKFNGELGVDLGGLLTQWYTLVSMEMCRRQWLLLRPTWKELYKPNLASRVLASPNSRIYLQHFRCLGRIVGKALFDNQLLAFRFTHAVNKLIVGQPLTAKDMQEEDHLFYKDIMSIFNYEAELDQIYQFMAFRLPQLDELGIACDVNLVPDGKKIPLTSRNIQTYVDKTFEAKLLTSIKPQMQSFLQGFDEVVPFSLTSMFTGAELAELISGTDKIDLADMRANCEITKSQAASDTSVVDWLFQILQSYSHSKRASFLMFVTGCPRVPSGGFQNRKIHIIVNDKPNGYPTASSCSRKLSLPNYRSREQMKQKLDDAIKSEHLVYTTA